VTRGFGAGPSRGGTHRREDEDDHGEEGDEAEQAIGGLHVGLRLGSRRGPSRIVGLSRRGLVVGWRHLQTCRNTHPEVRARRRRNDRSGLGFRYGASIQSLRWAKRQACAPRDSAHARPGCGLRCPVGRVGTRDESREHPRNMGGSSPFSASTWPMAAETAGMLAMTPCAFSTESLEAPLSWKQPHAPPLYPRQTRQSLLLYLYQYLSSFRQNGI
jgi:hypothetical protein